MINGVVFDMDGVLFDSERIYRDAWTIVGERMALPDINACVESCIGRNGQDTLKHLTEKYGPDFPAESFKAGIGAEFENLTAGSGPPLKPGVTALLHWLSDAGIPLGLATSTSFHSAERHLSKAGLISYFREVVTGDMVSRGKPDPEIYRLACSRLGIMPEESFAIEDSPNGIKSAHGAGLKVIMVPDLIAPTPDLDRLLHKTFVSLVEVQDYFKGLQS